MLINSKIRAPYIHYFSGSSYCCMCGHEFDYDDNDKDAYHPDIMNEDAFEQIKEVLKTIYSDKEIKTILDINDAMIYCKYCKNLVKIGSYAANNDDEYEYLQNIEFVTKWIDLRLIFKDKLIFEDLKVDLKDIKIMTNRVYSISERKRSDTLKPLQFIFPDLERYIAKKKVILILETKQL